MIRLIEYLLNGLIWCIHDIGRSIKDNPLTRAWKNIESSGGGRINPPFVEAKKLYEEAIKEQKMNNPSLGEMAAKFAYEQQNVFKEHVRREAQIIERLRPIRIWHTPYHAFSFPRQELQGVIVSAEAAKANSIAAAEAAKANNSWYSLLGGLGDLL